MTEWFRELDAAKDQMAFPNARRNPLSRHGVNYLMRQAAQKATSTCSSLHDKNVTPHVTQHTTAMHLLQVGIDIATIALWLGA
jgi:site-specific recombinase XerD